MTSYIHRSVHLSCLYINIYHIYPVYNSIYIYTLRNSIPGVEGFKHSKRCKSCFHQQYFVHLRSVLLKKIPQSKHSTGMEKHPRLNTSHIQLQTYSSVKLTAKAPENRPKRPKRKLVSIPTIHFQVPLLWISGVWYLDVAANVWTKWLHFAKTAIEPTTINPPRLMRYHPQILGYQWDPGIVAQGSKDPLVTNQIGFLVILLVWLIYLKKQIWMFGKRVPSCRN